MGKGFLKQDTRPGARSNRNESQIPICDGRDSIFRFFVIECSPAPAILNDAGSMTNEGNGEQRMESGNDLYVRLQKHMDSMPVGYPATRSGVELRLLERLFTAEQARIALELDYRFQTAEEIHPRLQNGMSLSALEAELETMVDSGVAFSKDRDGMRLYANLPLVVGMLELQTKRLTPELLRDTHQYFEEGYAGAYLRTAKPQMRVIPVEKSITAKHRIGVYDELRRLIEGAGDRIRIGECMCRKVAGMAGRSCSVTSRRETCMAFRDFADMLGRTGWGRAISREEALQIASQNEADGLVLQPANEQEARFVCSCCGDCCGILMMAKAMPRPADVVATNFYGQLDPTLCTGCGICVERCQMGALTVNGDAAILNRDRCIGCGLCVPTCPADAIALVRKEQELVPPQDMESLYEAIKAGPQPS